MSTKNNSDDGNNETVNNRRRNILIILLVVGIAGVLFHIFILDSSVEPSPLADIRVTVMENTDNSYTITLKDELESSQEVIIHKNGESVATINNKGESKTISFDEGDEIYVIIADYDTGQRLQKGSYPR